MFEHIPLLRVLPYRGLLSFPHYSLFYISICSRSLFYVVNDGRDPTYHSCIEPVSPRSWLRSIMVPWLPSCLPSWHASHMPMLSLSIKFGSLVTTPFDCMFWSFSRLIWLIVLCRNFKSVSTLRPFANMANFTLFDLRMKIRPSRWRELRVNCVFQRSTHHYWTTLACQVLVSGQLRPDFSWWLGHAERS